MHETLISGFNVLYLFGDNNLNKGLEMAKAVPVDPTGASHSLSVVQVLGSCPCHLMPHLPYSSAEQLPQMAYISSSPLTGVYQHGGATVEICDHRDLKSIHVSFWELGIEPKAPTFARQAPYRRATAPVFLHFTIFFI